jgi:SPP1 gp7 family putative phage head morphogenesis protein
MKSLSESMTIHSVLLQRYSGSEIKKFEAVLRKAAKDLQRLIAGDLSASEMHRLSAVEREALIIIKEVAGNLDTQLGGMLKELPKYESKYTMRLLEKFVTVKLGGISPEMVMAAVTQAPMSLISGKNIQHVSIPDAVRHFGDTAGREVLQSIRTGVISGRTTPQISKDVRDLILYRTKAQATALVRTPVNHIASTAKEAVYQEHEEVLEGERFIATLDANTTLTCMGYDQEVFPLGEGPIPPLHFNCRSHRVPEIKPEYRIPGFETKRASIDGPVSGRLTYDGFLRDQDKEFQDLALGPERGKLFREGMPVKRFTDDMGRVLSLKELEVLDNKFAL